MTTAATITVNVHEAKTQLSRLLALAEAGEEVVIARGGKPVARLVSIERPRPVRRFGAMRGLVSVDDNFFEPLPEAELAAWE
jgi:prevent-host-death family protein